MMKIMTGKNVLTMLKENEMRVFVVWFITYEGRREMECIFATEELAEAFVADNQSLRYEIVETHVYTE